MIIFPEKIYYESGIFSYPLGTRLREQYRDCEWIQIDNHNNIPVLRAKENTEFIRMKKLLIIGVRKTHRYTENHKVSDYLVPYTSSGCSAMCLYCYLLCHYNKCSYMRLFVNREQMLEKLIRFSAQQSREMTFEIGSNSDLVLENRITGNLIWTIENFAKEEYGYLTFPTKFAQIDDLLPLEHRGRIIFRISVNPEEIIRTVELGTSLLSHRITALNKMAEAGYPVGLLIAPVICADGYQRLYTELLSQLADTLSERVRCEGFIEIILMTYSYVHHAINSDAFPGLPPLWDPSKMTGKGRGKYQYREKVRWEAETFLRAQCAKYLPEMKILYIS